MAAGTCGGQLAGMSSGLRGDRGGRCGSMPSLGSGGRSHGLPLGRLEAYRRHGPSLLRFAAPRRRAMRCRAMDWWLPAHGTAGLPRHRLPGKVSVAPLARYSGRAGDSHRCTTREVDQ